MLVDTIIVGGKLFTEEGFIEAGVAIDEGLIVKVAKESNLPSANKVIRCEGKLILPGLIDPHVHFRDPGPTWKEDFESGTKAAAAGGFTLIFDMPNTNPIVDSEEAFRAKQKIVQEKAVVDFSLYGGPGTVPSETIPRLAKAGAIAFKLFTSVPGEDEEHFRGICATSREKIRDVIKASSENQQVLCVHAEKEDMIRLATARLRKEGRLDSLSHAESRPREAEITSVREVIEDAEAYNARVHFVHLSTKEAVNNVKDAKLRGLLVSAETCPQYLTLTAKILEEKGPFAKMNPPPRGEEDKAALLRALADGVVDVIGSDHAPHSVEEKEAGRRSIWNAPAGAPSIECSLPIVLTLVNKGLIDLHSVVKAMSSNVARTYRLHPKKGSLKEGSDADVTIVDLKMDHKVRKEDLYTKSRGSTFYDGWDFKGKAVTTMVRGMIVMDAGVVVGKPGDGVFTPPSKSSDTRR